MTETAPGRSSSTRVAGPACSPTFKGLSTMVDSIYNGWRTKGSGLTTNKRG
jgi:hypothetical protein